jgi:HSP90 family molecular chaperone
MNEVTPVTEEYPVTSEVGKLLRIIRQNLNLDPFTPVREYIANARDATRGLPNAKISVWGDDPLLYIDDNGRGMTKQIIQEGFTRIGGNFNVLNDNTSIGMFGVGSKSAFMAATKIVVETRHATEPNGWRLEWARDAVTYQLAPLEREAIGTRAIFHLEPSRRSLASSSQLRSNIARVFAMLPVPVYLGLNSAPVNTHWQWIADLSRQGDDPRLLFDREAEELVRQFTSEDLLVAYTSREPDGTRIILGIPGTEVMTLGGHKVALFSKGVLVQQGEEKFFPEHLSFVVGAVDCPRFKLQLDKEMVGRDEVFDEVRDSIERHVLTFLKLVGDHHPVTMEEILRVHRKKLVTHARQSAPLLTLFRKHYRFATSAGSLLWKDIVPFTIDPNSDGGRRKLHVVDASRNELNAIGLPLHGNLTVFPTGAEHEVLKAIANEDGVWVVEGDGLDPGIVSVPAPFKKLGARLGVALNSRGSWGVSFTNQPGAATRPALFRMRTVSKAVIRHSETSAETTLVSVDALLINIANPLVRRLAGLVDKLTEQQVRAAAELCFQTAVLHSGLREAVAMVSDEVIATMVRLYTQQLEGSATTRSVDDRRVKCFVALPFRPGFDNIFDGAQTFLGRPPYDWDLIRADQHVGGESLLANVQDHIASSRRFLADISGMNPNVLLELGMMLQLERSATVILCDRETYSEVPADLRGKVLAIYNSQCRSSAAAFLGWFETEVLKFNEFLAISSTEPRPRPKDAARNGDVARADA